MQGWPLEILQTIILYGLVWVIDFSRAASLVRSCKFPVVAELDLWQLLVTISKAILGCDPV